MTLNRWVRGILILMGHPLAVDGALLLLTFLFYQYVPHSIARDAAYGGGVVLMSFGVYSLTQSRSKTREEPGRSVALTYVSVTVATLAQLTAPGTWIYWLTIAGPILAEGRLKGHWHVVPFFAGSVMGFYGATIFSVWLLAWGASLQHTQFKRHLFLAANALLVVLGFSYLARAYYLMG